MKLVDLRRKPEKEKPDSKLAVGPEGDDFPWGLRLHLDDKTISKLGLKVTDIKAGSTLKLQAEVYVCGVNAQPDGKGKGLELQLVKMGIESDGSFEDGFKEASENDDG
ncbi:capsid staple protein [Maridesulfovibrio ferrireducens]|uniref:capsid staple protein n=1 Tax=Maridesulfovibrio ferrireducens TaxID=246191 RepID=UPI001A1F65C7|nr:hypothetical protein [Maridesulfovibrio ferrireducens]MBI9110326.1 hypothetical protein [Maridesulfovibrio ferrireducens]